MNPLCVRCEKEPRSSLYAKYCYGCKDTLYRLRRGTRKDTGHKPLITKTCEDCGQLKKSNVGTLCNRCRGRRNPVQRKPTTPCIRCGKNALAELCGACRAREESKSPYRERNNLTMANAWRERK